MAWRVLGLVMACWWAGATTAGFPVCVVIGLVSACWWVGPCPSMAGCVVKGVTGLVPACWWMCKPLALIGYREDSKMMLASTSILVVE